MFLCQIGRSLFKVRVVDYVNGGGLQNLAMNDNKDRDSGTTVIVSYYCISGINVTN